MEARHLNDARPRWSRESKEAHAQALACGAVIHKPSSPTMRMATSWTRPESSLNVTGS
jgi:hypothetical protein